MPHRGTCSPGRSLLRRSAALLGAAVLTLALAAPAGALGEEGPFELPVESTTILMPPGSVSSTPLLALLADDTQDQLVLDSARLAIDQDLPPEQQQLMELAEDGRTLTVEGQGTWSLLGDRIVFTPLTGYFEAPTAVALTIESDLGQRSLPVSLNSELLEVEESSVHASAGEAVSVPLPITLPEGGSMSLSLAGLPPGSTVLADGSRAVVPEQGSWQLAADGTALTHDPTGTGLGRQPDPVSYLSLDAEGAVTGAGRLILSVPIISDMYRSAPYGEDIVFSVGEGQQYVDPATLTLEPRASGEDFAVTQDGTEVEVPGQGTWSLDRDTATVRFSPESGDVQAVAPMGITGGDGEGATALPALLDTAYPILVDREQAAAPGEPVTIDLTLGVRDVRSDSLRFDAATLPQGARTSPDETEVTVPGEGTWTIDLEARTVTLVPDPDFLGTATPIGLIADGVHADNSARATLRATIAPVIATLRDDEGRTSVGTPLSIDVLGNDTAGSASQPLVPETVRIRSLAATNLTELEEAQGTRLVVPGEGTFSVAENGAISFEPAEGFVGRTTPITYTVLDAAGTPTSAALVVDVDPALEPERQSGQETAGINSLLVGLLPSSPGTATVFATIIMLLVFGGGVSLWIGRRMDADRRRWED
ncbi:MAG TPA: hypothetical protein H9837_00900 [Candidatus Brachybacterium merdigallinarum]|nr:hypothetical protein [Candidatus Brachybacterium merdigallinarum]